MSDVEIDLNEPLETLGNNEISGVSEVPEDITNSNEVDCKAEDHESNPIEELEAYLKKESDSSNLIEETLTEESPDPIDNKVTEVESGPEIKDPGNVSVEEAKAEKETEVKNKEIETEIETKIKNKIVETFPDNDPEPEPEHVVLPETMGPVEPVEIERLSSGLPPLPPRAEFEATASTISPNSRTPPPLPIRKPLENSGSFIEDEPPLNKSSLILNRLEVMIENLKDEDKFVSKPADSPTIEESDDFWSTISKDAVNTINSDHESLEIELIKGVDFSIRPQLWESITLSYCFNWNSIYEVLSEKPYPKMKKITRDIKNTLHDVSNVKPLSKIIESILSLNSDIAYNKNLLQLVEIVYGVYSDELKTFGIVSVLMKYYSMAPLFYENSESLSVLLYQFDRLLEENCHDLYDHLITKGIRSSMFATNWILSSFASVLPLEYAVQVMDVVLLEGVESLLKFALVLFMKNEDALLKLNFDDLLVFIKSRLFESYLVKEVRDELAANENENDEDSSIYHREFVTLTEDNFDVRLFITEAIEKTRITPELLKRYTDEYIEIHRNERAQEEQFENIKEVNSNLQNEVRQLEADYTSLNREHVTIANELLQNQIKIESVKEENTDMKLEVLKLRKELDNQVKKNKESSNAYVPSDIQKDFDKTLKKNGKVMQENLILQDRLSLLEKLIEEIKKATEEGIDFEALNGSAPNAFKSPILNGSWTGFKKVFK